MRKNCSSDREKLLKFEAEGREFSKFLRSLEQFIQTLKGQNNFGYKIPFLQMQTVFCKENKSYGLHILMKCVQILSFRAYFGQYLHF